MSRLNKFFFNFFHFMCECLSNINLWLCVSMKDFLPCHKDEQFGLKGEAMLLSATPKNIIPHCVSKCKTGDQSISASSLVLLKRSYGNFSPLNPKLVTFLFLFLFLISLDYT